MGGVDAKETANRGNRRVYRVQMTGSSASHPDIPGQMAERGLVEWSGAKERTSSPIADV
jgi:hypothetical protein